MMVGIMNLMSDDLGVSEAIIGQLVTLCINLCDMWTYTC